MQNNHQSNSQSSTGTASIVASRRKFSLSRNSKWWLSGGLLFLLAVAGYITYAVFTNLELDAASCTTKTLSSGNNTTCVKYAQQLLNGVSAYYSAMPRGAASIPSTLISANGKYGASTTDRLKTFQTYGGLESTGILNKNTWFALCSYVKSAYTSYSSNLRSDTINTAASAFSKVSCSTATQEAEDVQGTATASVSNVDTDDPETTGQTTTQDVAIVGDSERDISAKQMVNSPTSATSIPLTVTTWNIAGGSKGFNAAQRLAGLQTMILPI